MKCLLERKCKTLVVVVGGLRKFCEMPHNNFAFAFVAFGSFKYFFKRKTHKFTFIDDAEATIIKRNFKTNKYKTLAWDLEIKVVHILCICVCSTFFWVSL